MTLIIINKKDSGAIEQALKVKADILLMQDGAYFLNSNTVTPDFGDRKVYALKRDVEKRGLADRLVKDVEIIDYDGMIDLLFSSEKVVNL